MFQVLVFLGSCDVMGQASIIGMIKRPLGLESLVEGSYSG